MLMADARMTIKAALPEMTGGAAFFVSFRGVDEIALTS